MSIPEISEVEEAARRCPPWCTCCGDGHAGDDRRVRLSLMSPWSGHDVLYGAEAWVPAEVSACLFQRAHARLPMVEIDGPGKPLRLTLEEARDLGELLTALWEEGCQGVISAGHVQAVPA
jgi:hypothetical protein